MRDLQVSMLSQGQRQLVSVARALAGEPRLLLLDEPAAGLDSTESLWLAERLRAVRDTGVTILLVDHDMSLVLNLCDTIDVLDFGALIATGTPEEIRTQRAGVHGVSRRHAPAAGGVVSDTAVLDGAPRRRPAPASDGPVLECNGLDVGYGKLTVARDITFTLEPRDGPHHPRAQRRRQDDAADDAGRLPATPRRHHHPERAAGARVRRRGA